LPPTLSSIPKSSTSDRHTGRLSNVFAVEVQRRSLHHLVNAWRETPFFSDRERAALEWTEAVTRVADTHVPDDVYEGATAQFTEEELFALTFAVVVINSWNRLAVSFRAPAGTYQPRAVAV
jgi:alkylhydroperoxidase family enzyme